MHLSFYFIYQLYTLLTANAQGIPPSPCPGVFRYQLVDRPTGSMYSRVRGVITVQPDLSILVKIKFQVPIKKTDMPTFLHGMLKPKDKENVIMEKLKRGTLDEVIYNVDFPRNLPVPSIIQITVNGRLLCWSTPITAPTGQLTMELFHSLKTGVNYFHHNRLKQVPPMAQVYEGDLEEIPVIPVASPIPVIPTTPTFPIIPEIQKISKIPKIPLQQKLPWEIPGFENCGLEYSPKKLIFGGTMVDRGQGPWMVPLLNKEGVLLEYFCTSTLISTEHIITAAHCVKDKKRSDIVAYVGLYNLSSRADDEVQRRGISEVHIYPKYKDEVDYDLAILRLSHEVALNRYVNPVCVWNQEEDLRFIEGREATVFGWGKDRLGNKFVETPHIVRVPIVSQDACRESNEKFVGVTSSRTLCAGTRNGRGPCNGDSGGGLLLSEKDDKLRNRWVLRGVTSSSIQGNDKICHLDNYVIFSDVAKYKNWILGFIL